MAASFIATAAVVWTFSGASNSASRTIPTAAATFLACELTDATGDTVASTIAGASPTNSYQGTSGNVAAYLAVFVGAPAGAQTVAISGGDAGDEWSAGLRGVDAIDLVTPFDNQVTDAASPDSIAITTTSDGLAVGCIRGDPTGSTSDTEVFEGATDGFGNAIMVASTPGTGGSVSVDWIAATASIGIGVNLRNGVVTGNLAWVTG